MGLQRYGREQVSRPHPSRTLPNAYWVYTRASQFVNVACEEVQYDEDSEDSQERPAFLEVGSSRYTCFREV